MALGQAGKHNKTANYIFKEYRLQCKLGWAIGLVSKLKWNTEMEITTDFKQIYEANAAVIVAMQDLGFVTPECMLDIRGPDSFTVTLRCSWNKGPRLNNGLLQCHIGKTAGEAYRKALKKLADMPDPKTVAMNAHMKRIAECVDKGRADGIPDEYIDPLCVVTKSMSDNLLAAPK